MAIQFPADPTVGQEFAGWRWDGEKWTCIPPEGIGGGWQGIEDAPADGNLYGRNNGEWSIIPPPTTTGVIGVSAFNGRDGHVNLTWADVSNAGGAPLNSPGFTGTPNAPTPGSRIATTQMVTAAFLNNYYFPLTGGTISPGPSRQQSTSGFYMEQNCSGEAIITISGPASAHKGIVMNTSGNASAQVTVMGSAWDSTRYDGLFSWRYNSWGQNLGIHWCIMPSNGDFWFGGAGGENLFTSNFNVGNVWDIWGMLYVTSSSPISDERIKDNIRPSTVDALAALNHIPIVQYDLRQDIHNMFLIHNADAPRHTSIGMTTQGVAPHIPDAILTGAVRPRSPTIGPQTTNPMPDDVQSLDISLLVSYLVKATQQLGARIEALEQR